MEALCWKGVLWKVPVAHSVFLGGECLGTATEIGGLKEGTPGDKPNVAVPAAQEAQGRPSVLVGEEPVGGSDQERGAAEAYVAQERQSVLMGKELVG